MGTVTPSIGESDTVEVIRLWWSLRWNRPLDGFTMRDSLPAFGWKGIAQGSGTSPDTLRALAVRGRSAVRVAVGANPKTDVATLAYLAHGRNDGGVRASVAGNGEAPEALLGFLAQDPDPDVRAEIASNPRSPVPALVLLTQDTSSAVRHRALSNPRISERIKGFLQSCQRVDASRPRTAAEALASLVQDGGASTDKLITTAWADKDVPGSDVLAVLAYSPGAAIRAGVAKHRNTDPKTLTMLALSMKEEDVLRGVIANHSTPPGVLEAFAAGAEAPTRTYGAVVLAKGIALNPNASTRALDLIVDQFELRTLAPPHKRGYTDEDQVLRAVSTHPHSAPHTLERLAEAGFRDDVVKNPNAPASLLREAAQRAERLREQDDRWERYQDWDPLSKTLASNPSTPTDIVRELFRAGFSSEVAANPNAPAELLAALTTKLLAELEGEVTARLGGYSSLWNFLSMRSDESWWDFKPLHNVALNPNSPTSTLTELADFAKNAVGVRSITDSASFNREVIQLLRSLAENPRTPEESLRQVIAAEGRTFAPSTIWDNPNVPADLKPEYPHGAYSAARDPKTQPSVLAALSDGASEHVLEALGRNPSTPAATLIRLADHRAEEVRTAVARNANAPQQAIATLSGTSDTDVQVALNLHHHFRLM